jgi:hypothetical protein
MSTISGQKNRWYWKNSSSRCQPQDSYRVCAGLFVTAVLRIRPLAAESTPCCLALSRSARPTPPRRTSLRTKVVQDPQRLQRDRGERRVELGEASRPVRIRVRHIDHGLVPIDAIAKESPRGGEVGALPVELTVPIEERSEDVEVLVTRAHDRDVRGSHRCASHISRPQARREEDSADRESAGQTIRDRDPDRSTAEARDGGGHRDRADAGAERVAEDVRKLHR